MNDVTFSVGIDKQKLFREVLETFQKANLAVANAGRTGNRSFGGWTPALGRIKGELGEFEKSLAASNARVVAFGASAGSIYAIGKALKDTVRAAIDVQQKLTEIAVIMGRSTSSMTSFGEQLFSIANSMGQSFDTAAQAAFELSRQGYGLQQTLKKTSDALLLARMSGLSVTEAVSTITASVNSMNSQFIDTTRLVNQMAAVDMKFAVSSADLAEAIKRVGSTADDAGVSMEQLIALVTSAQHITSRGGAIIGNAFKSIFTRLERPKVLESLEGVGVQIKNLDGTTRPVISVLGDLANKFDDLSQAQQSHVAELVGGVYQMNILKAALRDISKDYSFYSQALNTANRATDEAQQRSEELNKTLASQLTRTINNLTKAGAGIGTLTFGPVIKKVLTTMEDSSDSWGGELGQKVGSAFFAGLGKMLAGPGISAITLIFLQLGKRMLTFVEDALEQVSGLANSGKNRLELEKQIIDFLGREPQLFKEIISGSKTVNDLQERFVATLTEATQKLQAMRVLAKEVSTAMNVAGFKAGNPDAPAGITTPVQSKAMGHIPEIVERVGAFAGGYAPGQVKTMMLDGKPVVYNTAERVVPINQIIPGAKSKSAFIIPPEGSDARREYDKKLQQKGLDPRVFSALGRIPNLAMDTVGMDELEPDSGRVKPNWNPTAADFAQKPLVRYLSLEPKLGTLNIPGQTAHYHGLQAEKSGLLRNMAKTDYEALVNRVTETIFNVNPSAHPFTVKEGSPSFAPLVGNLFEDSLRTALNIAPSALSKDIPKGTKTMNEASVLSSFMGSEYLTPGIINKEGAEIKSSFAASSSAFRKGQATAGDFQEKLLRLGITYQGQGGLNNERRTIIRQMYQEYGEGLWNMGKKQVKDELNKRYVAYKNAERASASMGMIPNMALAAIHGGAMPDNVNKAVKREENAGYSPSQVKVGYDPRIGTLVYNTTEGSPSRAVDMHLQKGESLDKIRKLGARNVPNLAMDDEGAGTNIALGISMFASQLALSRNGGYRAKEVSELDERIEATKSEIHKAEESEKRDVKHIATLSTKLKTIEDERVKLNKIIALDERKRSRALATSFIAPIGGGIAESLLSSSAPRLGKAIGGFSEAISTASQVMFALPGPLGNAAALATGSLLGVSKVYHAFADKGDSLQRKLDKQKDSFETLNSSVNSFSQVFEKLNEAYHNQSTSAETISKLHTEYARTLADVPEEYRDLIASASTAQEAQNRVAEAMAKQANNINQTSLSAKLNTRLDTSDHIFFNGKVFDTKTEEGRKEVSTLASRSIAYANKPEDFARRLASTNIGSGGDFVKMIKSAKEAGEISDDLAQAFERLGDRANGLHGFVDNSVESLNALNDQLQKTAKATLDAARNFDLTQKIRDSQARLEIKFRAANEEATKSIESLTDAIHALAGQGVSFAGTRATLANNSRSNLGSSQVALTENAVKLFGGGLSDEVKGNLDEVFGLIKNQFENADKFREADTAAVNNMFNSVQQALDAVKAMGEEVGAGEVMKNPADEQKSIAALEALSTLRGKLGNASPEEASQALGKFARDFDDVLGEKFGTVVNKNDQIIRELVTTRATLNQDFQEQIRQTILNNQISEQARRTAERQKLLGGAQGFLNPSSYRESFTKLLRGATTLSVHNDDLSKGKGAFDFLQGVKETFGFDPKSRGAVALRDLAVQARTREIQNTGQLVSSQLNSFALGSPEGSVERNSFAALAQEIKQRSTGPEAAKAAKEQIESAIPLEQMPRDIAKQVTLLEEIYGVLSGDIKTALREGAGASDNISSFGASQAIQAIQARQGLVKQFENRQKDVKNSRDITAQTASLVNSETADTKDEKIVSTLQNLFANGDFEGALKTIARNSHNQGRQQQATKLLDILGKFGGNRKVEEVLNQGVQAGEKTATIMSQMLAISTSGNSHSVHDHHAEKLLEQMPQEIANAIASHTDLKAPPAEGGTNAPTSQVKGSSIKNLVGRGLEVGGLGLLALTVGTQRGRAGLDTIATGAYRGAKAFVGRGPSVNVKDLYNERLTAQENRLSIGNGVKRVSNSLLTPFGSTSNEKFNPNTGGKFITGETQIDNLPDINKLDVHNIGPAVEGKAPRSFIREIKAATRQERVNLIGQQIDKIQQQISKISAAGGPNAQGEIARLNYKAFGLLQKQDSILKTSLDKSPTSFRKTSNTPITGINFEGGSFPAEAAVVPPARSVPRFPRLSVGRGGIAAANLAGLATSIGLGALIPQTKLQETSSTSQLIRGGTTAAVGGGGYVAGSAVQALIQAQLTGRGLGQIAKAGLRSSLIKSGIKSGFVPQIGGRLLTSAPVVGGLLSGLATYGLAKAGGQNTEEAAYKGIGAGIGGLNPIPVLSAGTSYLGEKAGELLYTNKRVIPGLQEEGNVLDKKYMLAKALQRRVKAERKQQTKQQQQQQKDATAGNNYDTNLLNNLQTTSAAYGVDDASLQRYYKKYGNRASGLPQQAALIRLAQNSQKGSLSNYEQILFKTLGKEYVGGDFTGNNFANSKSWKEMIQKYRNNVNSLGNQGTPFAAEGEGMKPYYNNVGGYTYASKTPDKYAIRQQQYDEALQTDNFQGRVVFKNNDVNSQFLRSLHGDNLDRYLGRFKTPQDYAKDVYSAAPPVSAQAMYDLEQKKIKALNAPSVAQPPQPGPTQAGQETGVTVENFKQAMQDVIGDKLEALGKEIVEGIRGNGGNDTPNGTIQLDLPKLDLNVSGNITMDGQPVTPDNNVVTKIMNEVLKALGRNDLVKPVKQDAGGQKATQ